MRYTIIISLLVCLSFSIPDNSIELSSLKKVDNTYFFNEQKFTGYTYKNHPNGELGIFGKIIHGVKDSIWTMWYSNKALKATIEYDKGSKNGFAKYYYKNGVKAKEVLYKYGKAFDIKMWDTLGNERKLYGKGCSF